MDIVTNNDGRAAIGALTIDLNATYNNVPNIQALVGNDDLQQAAYGLLNTINNYAQRIYNQLTVSDDPLTPTQLNQIQLLQNQVIDARQTIGTTISDVSWSYPSLLMDVTQGIKNTISQAATAVGNAIPSPFNIPWTYIIIAGIAIAGFYYYVKYFRRKGT